MTSLSEEVASEKGRVSRQRMNGGDASHFRVERSCSRMRQEGSVHTDKVDVNLATTMATRLKRREGGPEILHKNRHCSGIEK